MAVSGTADAPLFLTGNADWYLSNASILWAANAVEADGVTYNGGTRYVPRTDGKRNDCFERFFLTLSPAVRGGVAHDSQPGLALEVGHRHASLARATGRRTASRTASSGPTATAGA